MVPTPGQTISGMIVGGIVMAALYLTRRLVDWYFPRGRMSRWAREHSVPTAGPEDEEG